MRYLDYRSPAWEKERTKLVAAMRRAVREELGWFCCPALLARMASCCLVLLPLTSCSCSCCLLAARRVSRQVSAQASRSALQPAGDEQVGAHWAELLQDNHTDSLQ